MGDKKSALIIGNSQYEDALLRQLVAPSRDAETLAEVLADGTIGGFDVHTVTDAPSYRVCEEIEAFFDDRDRDHLLLLYFSGHGVTDDDGMLYYATSNTHHKRMRSTAVAANWVNEVMSQCRSRRQVLLLDCCHSGAFARTKAAGTANVAVHLGGRTPEEGRGRFVLTASDAFQYSFEGEAVQGEGVRSVFTDAVVQGLRTGQADLDGDGLITLDELYSYVHRRVKEQTPQQSPRKWESDVEGGLVIALNPRPTEAALPEDLQNAIDNLIPEAREKAMPRLERLLRAKHKGLALSAHSALLALAQDDSRRVSMAAQRILAMHEDRLAAEQGEAERVHIGKIAPAASRVIEPEPQAPQNAAVPGAVVSSLALPAIPRFTNSQMKRVKPTRADPGASHSAKSKGTEIKASEVANARPVVSVAAPPMLQAEAAEPTVTNPARRRWVVSGLCVVLAFATLGLARYWWLGRQISSGATSSSQGSTLVANPAPAPPINLAPSSSSPEAPKAATTPAADGQSTAAGSPPHDAAATVDPTSSAGAPGASPATTPVGKEAKHRDGAGDPRGRRRSGSSPDAGSSGVSSTVAAVPAKPLTVDELVRRGDTARLTKNYTLAVASYREAAEQGNAYAQNLLGDLYQSGLGVTTDYLQAAQWYRKAADQGDALAQFNLAVLYQMGWGLSMDYVQAAQWYRKAADQELPRAQYSLSVMYHNGWGVSRNQAQAQSWLQRATANGYQPSK